MTTSSMASPDLHSAVYVVSPVIQIEAADQDWVETLALPLSLSELRVKDINTLKKSKQALKYTYKRICYIVLQLSLVELHGNLNI